jgi:hypothetical protein
MAEREIMPDSPQVDFKTIDNISKFACSYHEHEDTLFIRTPVPRPAVSVDWDGELWLRVDPSSGEIVGIEIEDFESVFLKKYPQLIQAWKTARPYCCKQGTSKNGADSSLTIIFNFLRLLFKENPKQGKVNLIPAV